MLVLSYRPPQQKNTISQILCRRLARHRLKTAVSISVLLNSIHLQSAGFKTQAFFPVLKSCWGEGQRELGKKVPQEIFVCWMNVFKREVAWGGGIEPAVRQSWALLILWQSPRGVSPGWPGCRSRPAWCGCDPWGCHRGAYLVVKAPPLG